MSSEWTLITVTGDVDEDDTALDVDSEYAEEDGHLEHEVDGTGSLVGGDDSGKGDDGFTLVENRKAHHKAAKKNKKPRDIPPSAYQKQLRLRRSSWTCLNWMRSLSPHWWV